MSIVLVVIGLLAGGMLMGQDMIKAAAIRAQISQIEKFSTAVNAFNTKYAFLPGDIPATAASQAGLQTRGTNTGEGDGNEILQSNCNDVVGTMNGSWQGCGELAVFWEDLSKTGLIDAAIAGSDTNGNGWPDIKTHFTNITATTTPNISGWLPSAKIGNNTYVYVYSNRGINYFSVSGVSKIGWNIESSNGPGLSVLQAYTIDSKIDDGLPQTGSVTACYENYLANNSPSMLWAAGNNLIGANNGIDWTTTGTYCTVTTAATAYASTNCFDNNNVAGAQQYSIKQNANSLNCALSFQFK